MNVEAVRDDGALLVTAGGDAAVLLTGDGTFVTSTGAALARGDWRDPNGEVVPLAERDRVRELLVTADRELDGVVRPLTSAMIETTAQRDTRRATRVRELRERVGGGPGGGDTHRRDDRAGTE